MRSRTRHGRFACLVVVVLTVSAVVVACPSTRGPVWAGYGATAPEPAMMWYTHTPAGPEQPTGALPSTGTPYPTPVVTNSVAPITTASATSSALSLTITPSFVPRIATSAVSEQVTLTSTETMTPTLTPTPTVTDTPTPTSTPTPAPIKVPIFLSERELIFNGTFESGRLEPYWRNLGTLKRQVTSAVRYSGLYSVLLGDPAYRSDGWCPAGVAAIYQPVEVPRTGQVTLRFWYLMQSYDTKQFDYLAVIVADTPDLSKTPVFTQGRTYWDEWLWSSGWREAKISLSSFKGQTVYIMLANVMGNEDGWYNTWTYVDDVRIEYRP